MQRHMKDRHQTHVGEADHKQHQEGYGRIVLIHERIKDYQTEISTEDQFKDGKKTSSSKIFLRGPAVMFSFDPIFRRSLEAALDPQERLHNRL